jgi:nitroimidazol reductase NimA-like FMN-containing flavoprotein (pyridoxamine 5'-phosphate oxidase superfamily)
MYEPVDMPYEKCLELLSGGVVGRVALSLPDGPQIFPVNYSVVADAVVFRTAPYSILGTRAWSTRLAFEVDHIDYERQRGWSVVATGPGELVEDEEDLASIRSFWDPRPWAGGPRLLYVRLRWDSLTGRRLGSGWSSRDEMPVRRSL